jgi:hypothetical protein
MLMGLGAHYTFLETARQVNRMSASEVFKIDMQKLFQLALLLAIAAALVAISAGCSGGKGPSGNIDFTWLASDQNDIVFDASQLVNGMEVTSFHWDFGDGNVQTTTQDVIHHQYAAAGDYTVTLTGTDNLGNVYTATHIASASP